MAEILLNDKSTILPTMRSNITSHKNHTQEHNGNKIPPQQPRAPALVPRAEPSVLQQNRNMINIPKIPPIRPIQQHVLRPVPLRPKSFHKPSYIIQGWTVNNHYELLHLQGWTFIDQWVPLCL